MTPCYCALCKRELPLSSISDDDCAWCPECRSVVEMSCFQVPAWVAAVVVLLTMHADLLLA
jgi:hypothetical protein